jgi:hypothetical protein
MQAGAVSGFLVTARTASEGHATGKLCVNRASEPGLRILQTSPQQVPGIAQKYSQRRTAHGHCLVMAFSPIRLPLLSSLRFRPEPLKKSTRTTVVAIPRDPVLLHPQPPRPLLPPAGEGEPSSCGVCKKSGADPARPSALSTLTPRPPLPPAGEGEKEWWGDLQEANVS